MKIVFEIPDPIFGTTSDSPYYDRVQGLSRVYEVYAGIAESAIYKVHTACIEYLCGELPEGAEAAYLGAYLQTAESVVFIATPLLKATAEAINAELLSYPEYDDRRFEWMEEPFAASLESAREMVCGVKKHPPGNKP